MVGFDPLGSRAAGWERALQEAARRLKTDLTRLPAVKSAPEKVRLAAYLKQAHGVANGWLTQRLSMGTPASVSKFVQRFRAAGGFSPAAHKALSGVKK